MEEAVVRNLPTGDLDAAPSGEEARHAPVYEPKPLGFWGEADRERIMRPRQQPLIPPDHEETPSAVPPASERPASEPDSFPEPLLYGEEGLPWDKVPDNHAAPSFHEAPQAFAAPQPPTAGAAPLPETAPHAAVQPPAANRARPSEPEQPEIEQLGEGQVRVGPYVYMGQIGGTYLLLRDIRNGRDNASLLILDQHAAHERVLVSRIEAGGFSGMSQPLVLPARIYAASGGTGAHSGVSRIPLRARVRAGAAGTGSRNRARSARRAAFAGACRRRGIHP